MRHVVKRRGVNIQRFAAGSSAAICINFNDILRCTRTRYLLMTYCEVYRYPDSLYRYPDSPYRHLDNLLPVTTVDPSSFRFANPAVRVLTAAQARKIE